MKLPESRRCPKKNAGLVHKGRIKIKTMGRDGVVLNHENIDLRYVEQLADSEQLTCLGYLLRYMEEQEFDGQKRSRTDYPTTGEEAGSGRICSGL